MIWSTVMIYMIWSWDIEQNILKLVILGHFLPFYPPKTPKIKIFNNEKNCWWYHHFTHVYQKSQYPIIWCRVREIQSETDRIFCHFGPFLPKMEILSFTHVHHKWQSYNVCSWDMKYNGQNFLSFWTIFCPFTSLTTWKIKILKKSKKCLEISCVPKTKIRWCKFLRCDAQQTDRQMNGWTDRWMEKVIYRGGCPT